jgi:hypothetical protein
LGARTADLLASKMVAAKVENITVSKVEQMDPEKVERKNR